MYFCLLNFAKGIINFLCHNSLMRLATLISLCLSFACQASTIEGRVVGVADDMQHANLRADRNLEPLDSVQWCGGWGAFGNKERTCQPVDVCHPHQVHVITDRALVWGSSPARRVGLVPRLSLAGCLECP
jgi:hypothetical protein